MSLPFPRGRLLLLPMLGSALALCFRPSELPRTRTVSLSLPDGEALRFLQIPATADAPALTLSLLEVPDRLWRQFSSAAPDHAAAEDFCRWLSIRSGQSLRLPTAAEWRRAAAGDSPGAEFPWGFGPPIPPPGIAFALDAPPRKPGSALGWGFRDLAGGRWEWTAEGLLLGGAWSERDPETLRIDGGWQPPPGYRGRDTALRLVWEREGRARPAIDIPEKSDIPEP